jgi:formyltetrahydrofolate-dependent phosphoribosylglycinamide formyltransferase
MNDGTKPRVAVFVSGGGSNLQSLIDATKAGILRAEIALVVSSRKKAHGMQRAADAGIDSFVFRFKKYETPEAAGQDLLGRLKDHGIDYVALAGFLSLLPAAVVQAYRNRIVNIHPALLPKYGGKGMYGHHVHDAVLAAGDLESGPTVHIVDEIYDNGQILEQVRVPVLPNDTADTLAARVLQEEHKLYPRVLQKLIKGEYTLE